MKSIRNNEQGIAHIALIVLFLVVFAGLGTLAYTRVSDNKASEVATTQDEYAGSEEDLASDEDQADPAEDIDKANEAE